MKNYIRQSVFYSNLFLYAALYSNWAFRKLSEGLVKALGVVHLKYMHVFLPLHDKYECKESRKGIQAPPLLLSMFAIPGSISFQQCKSLVITSFVLLSSLFPPPPYLVCGLSCHAASTSVPQHDEQELLSLLLHLDTEDAVRRYVSAVKCRLTPRHHFAYPES